jgi:hypothetical protein
MVGLAAVTGIVATSSSATPSQRPSSSKHPHLSVQRIVRIALLAARQAGDPAPLLVQHSEGTRRQANLVDSGEIVTGDRWSYLIAARGRFVADNAPRPPGAPAPRGSVLTLVVDAATGRVTDSGISNRYPDLSRLGSVKTDLPGERKGLGPNRAAQSSGSSAAQLQT